MIDLAIATTNSLALTSCWVLLLLLLSCVALLRNS
jgi:hypothetical protein